MDGLCNPQREASQENAFVCLKDHEQNTIEVHENSQVVEFVFETQWEENTKNNQVIPAPKGNKDLIVRKQGKASTIPSTLTRNEKKCNVDEGLDPKSGRPTKQEI